MPDIYSPWARYFYPVNTRMRGYCVGWGVGVDWMKEGEDAMKAFKVKYNRNNIVYFCSLACAAIVNVPPQNGKFVVEKDYPCDERCINCAVHINDVRRALVAYPAKLLVDGGKQ